MRFLPRVRRARLAVLGLAAAGALLCGVALLALAFGPRDWFADPVSPADARAQAVKERIAATPGVADVFARLRALSAADHDAVIRKAVETPPGAAADSPDHWLSDAVRVARQSHGALAAKADAGPLSAIFARQLAVIAALRDADTRLCVDFLYGGASEAFFAFAERRRDLVSALALANLDAMADGRARKIEREAVTDEDFGILEAALRERGLNAAEITALLDGKSPDPPLPDPRLCEMGQIYLEAVASLPEPARLRLYALAAELMARS